MYGQATLPESVIHETSPIEQVRNILTDDRNGKRPMIASFKAVELRGNNYGNPWIESGARKNLSQLLATFPKGEGSDQLQSNLVLI